MENNTELKGKIALVTGGTKGIGKAIADRLTLAGAKVIVTARTKPAEADFSYHFIAADLSQAEGAEKVVSEVNEKFGGVDILINNTGGLVSPGGGFNFLTDEHWTSTFQLNVLSAVRLDKALLPKMLEQKSGVIIHISSVSGLQPNWDINIPYAAAKAALNNYSKALANEVSGNGVRVLTVSPGATRTGSMVGFIQEWADNAGVSLEEMTKNLIAKIGGVPMGRLAEPSEVADLVNFLVSPSAAYLTGANYVIEGGAIQTV